MIWPLDRASNRGKQSRRRGSRQRTEATDRGSESRQRIEATDRGNGPRQRIEATDRGNGSRQRIEAASRCDGPRQRVDATDRGNGSGPQVEARDRDNGPRQRIARQELVPDHRNKLRQLGGTTGKPAKPSAAATAAKIWRRRRALRISARSGEQDSQVKAENGSGDRVRPAGRRIRDGV